MSEVVVNLAGSDYFRQNSKPGINNLGFEGPADRITMEQGHAHQRSSLKRGTEGDGGITLFHFANCHR